MKTARITGWVAAFFMMTALAMAQTTANPPSGPDAPHWVISYNVPEDVKTVTLTLAYRFWDINVDGDVASKRVLLVGKAQLPPGKKKVTIAISLSADKSEILVDGVVVKLASGDAGKGYPLDASFSQASVPKLNENGAYVLAQKPVDPQKPAALGVTGDAAAWIELGIDVRP